jgi:peptidoglycan/xylan/chitin deacetylase (PgdA/CDA1 family)
MRLRQRLTYGLKRVAARVLYTVGLLQIWQAIVLRRRAVVLMYHRVLTPAEREAAASHPALVVMRDTFARQMAFLRKRFIVLSPAEFAEHVRQRRPFPSSSCVITFDDGWRDNYDNAWPILSALELPSLIFLPINYIGQRRVFWQEAFVQLLRRALLEVQRQPGRRAVFEALLARVGLAAVLTEPASEPSLTDLVTAQKGLTRETVDRFVTELAEALGVSLSDLAAADGFIDWAQVEAMAGQGVTFGGHGVDHLLLTKVSEAQVEAEVVGSKAALDDRLNVGVPAFSYPNGYCTPAIAASVRRAGFQLAFIAEGGPVTCTDDPWTLSRINIHESLTDTEPLFLARLVGLL